MKLGLVGELRKSPAIALLSHYVTQQVTFDQPVLAPLEALKRVLSKPAKERTTKALQFLLNFTKGIKFFTELGEEAHYQCCLHMTYNFTSAGEVLFHQGDLGAEFFVVLSGRCGVLISDEGGNFSEVLTYQTGDSFGEFCVVSIRVLNLSISLCIISRPVSNLSPALLFVSESRDSLAKIYSLRASSRDFSKRERSFRCISDLVLFMNG